jgi:hypothetical protein
MAVPRLRVCYYTTLAILVGTLVLAHRLVVREHRDVRLLTVAANACQLPTALPVIFVRVPPVGRAAMKNKPNIHRAAAAVKEK